MKFSNKVVSMVLNENELYKVRDRARWDEERNDWKIPWFYVNHKEEEIAFPTINARDRVQQARGENEVTFNGGEDPRAGSPATGSLSAQGRRQ